VPDAVLADDAPLLAELDADTPGFDTAGPDPSGLDLSDLDTSGGPRGVTGRGRGGLRGGRPGHPASGRATIAASSDRPATPSFVHAR
jgi:hypothetical protein